MIETILQWLDALNLTRFKPKDFLDIVLVAVGVYYLLIVIRGTRAMRIAIGIIFLVLLSYLSNEFKLETVQWLLSNFFTYLVIAIIILFQAEIRKTLAQFGKNPFRKRSSSDEDFRTLEEVCLAASLLASKRHGAIIVMEKAQGLKNYVEGGRQIDAEVNYDLLIAIFNPGSPLHDGAVIIQDNHIAAAACFLPLTSNPQLSTTFGTRHRAAVGLTEETDAVAVIVSEERGAISVAQNGRITKPMEGKALMKLLSYIFIRNRDIPPRDIARRTKDLKQYDFSSLEAK
ncbi:MAG TPA: diadenylate cyclase CdaA [Acidobacteriota bacterium]|nr:diadenylate cyclase CdaA [Acidobacteriota bacterium]